MRVLHFDCFSGISGDMVLGALIDAGVDPVAIRAVLDSFGLPITMEVSKVKRNGFAATRVEIVAPDQEEYRFLPDVEAILAKSVMTPRQRDLALKIFHKLAVAEATAHGMPLEKVHFHEVGALDSIADIAGAAVAIDLLGVEWITCRSVPPGSGTVKCAHGMMPVPTPATALLLQGVPLATPPLKQSSSPAGRPPCDRRQRVHHQPTMTIERTGCGAGKRPRDRRILRVSWDFTPQAAQDVDLLETNLDDVSPEVIGYCVDQLFAAGALDVFTVPVQMKKNRPGVLLTVLTSLDRAEEMEAIVFRETGTFGIRRSTATRSKLDREAVTVETPWGPVKAKKGWRAEMSIFTPEYEDCVRVARENGVALRDVYAAVSRNANQPGA